MNQLKVIDLINILLDFDIDLPITVEKIDGEEYPLTEDDIYEITMETFNQRVLFSLY